MGVLNYKEAVLKIKSFERIGLKPGLQRMKKVLGMMGNPQKNMKFIHVAGTNGKGSVCYMLASILKESGYRTGLFVSPSIEDFRERIQINGEMISQDGLCRTFESIDYHLNNSYFKIDPITEFELTTAIAFKYFHEKKCDIVVLETGMGGRLDATNVIENPLCSVITTVSFDHENFLGNTIPDIASEKFGIIKPKSNVVIGANQSDEVYKLAEKMCGNLNSKYFIADLNKIEKFKCIDLKKSTFKYNGIEIEFPLLGEHQCYNVAVVVKVMELLKDKLHISDKQIAKGIKNVKIPCRIEVAHENPLVILDASHNIEGANALSKFISENLKDRRAIAISGMFSDKDIDGVFELIGKYFDKIITVQSNSSRAISAENMANIVKKYNKNVFFHKTLWNGFEDALSSMSDDDVLIVFGSFSIMNDARKFIKFHFSS